MKSTAVTQRNAFIGKGIPSFTCLTTELKPGQALHAARPSHSPGNDVVVESRMVFRDRRDERFWLPLFNQFLLFLQKKGHQSMV